MWLFYAATLSGVAGCRYCCGCRLYPCSIRGGINAACGRFDVRCPQSNYMIYVPQVSVSQRGCLGSHLNLWLCIVQNLPCSFHTFFMLVGIPLTLVGVPTDVVWSPGNYAWWTAMDTPSLDHLGPEWVYWIDSIGCAQLKASATHVGPLGKLWQINK